MNSLETVRTMRGEELVIVDSQLGVMRRTGRPLFQLSELVVYKDLYQYLLRERLRQGWPNLSWKPRREDIGSEGFDIDLMDPILQALGVYDDFINHPQGILLANAWNDEVMRDKEAGRL